jgi:hypothetical protein
MPETPEQIHARAVDHLRMPPVEEWEEFPFDGDMRPRALLAPLATEEPRNGEGGVDCWSCGQPDEAYLWTDEHWRLLPAQPNGLPVVVLLETRDHYAEPGDLPDDLAAELGILIARIERAVRVSARSAACTSADGATGASTCIGGSWPVPHGSHS